MNGTAVPGQRHAAFEPIAIGSTLITSATSEEIR